MSETAEQPHASPALAGLAVLMLASLFVATLIVGDLATPRPR